MNIYKTTFSISLIALIFFLGFGFGNGLANNNIKRERGFILGYSTYKCTKTNELKEED